MILEYKYEDKFHNGELTIGLSLDGYEIRGSNYKRIILRNPYFKKEDDHYKNIRAFGFPASIGNWGFINGCFCFHENEVIGMGEIKNKLSVANYTTVMFEIGNFEIWFNE